MSKRPLGDKGGDSNKEQKLDESTALAVMNPPLPAQVALHEHYPFSLILSFSLLNLSDRARLASVSNAWRNLMINQPMLENLVVGEMQMRGLPDDSIFLTHIAECIPLQSVMWIFRPLTLQVHLIRLPRLRKLYFKAQPPSYSKISTEDKGQPFLFLATLVELQIRTSLYNNRINSILGSVGHLPHLEVFRLYIDQPTYDFWKVIATGPVSMSDIHFGLLNEAPNLVELYIESNYDDAEFSEDQIAILRNLPKLKSVPCGFMENRTLIRRLLQEPHYDWTSFRTPLGENDIVTLRVEDEHLLRQLPNLNRLFFQFDPAPALTDPSFLAHLNNLTDLTISSKFDPPTPTVDKLVTSLQHLNKLTRLNLTAITLLTSDHLTLLLDHLVRLETLILSGCSHFQSLAFLRPSLISIKRITIFAAINQLALQEENQVHHPLSLPHLNEFTLSINHVQPPGFNAEQWWLPLRNRLRDRLMLQFQGQHPPAQ